MTTFVYLGPSLPRDAAATILDAVYLDPIAMGDLYALVQTRAKPGDRVAIIDGLFEQVPAVWHKEILHAIEKGIAVYGASSMGALRAAELHVFGMRGIGRVFESYRDALIEDDDEVAVAHAAREEGFRSLSTAMVSIRFGLRGLLDAGALTLEQHDTLCAHAKAQHYTVRSWAGTYAYAQEIGVGADVLDALRTIACEPDAKARDAMDLLRYLYGLGDAPEEIEPTAFVLEQTGLWRALTQSQEARVVGDSLKSSLSSASIDPEVVSHLRAIDPSRDAVLREALLMKIAMEGRYTSVPSAADLKAAMFRLAARNGLRTSQELLAWRERQCLGNADWKTILEMEARVQQMSQNAIPGMDAYLLAALKANGRYARVCADVTDIRQRFGEGWLKQLSADDFDIGYSEIQAWYEQSVSPMLPNPEAHAQSLGFQTLAEFVTRVLAQYLISRDPVAQPAPESVQV